MMSFSYTFSLFIILYSIEIKNKKNRQKKGCVNYEYKIIKRK